LISGDPIIRFPAKRISGVCIERDGIFHPLEIKAGARVTEADARSIRAFRATYPHLRHGPGVIVAAVDRVFARRDRILVVPYDLAPRPRTRPSGTP
jgi:hypothetical protein